MKLPLVRSDVPTPAELAQLMFHLAESGERLSNFGPVSRELEAEAEAYLGVPCAAVSSCTIGLVFALKAAGLKPGQHVIMPSFTFAATAQAVIAAGGIPRFCDIDEDFRLSLSSLEGMLFGRIGQETTGAVMPVHCYGTPENVGPIGAMLTQAIWRTDRSIPLVYDSAAAFGAESEGRKVGCFGDAEVFSLSGTKPMTSVEGGLVASRHTALLSRVRRASNYGLAHGTYHTTGFGLNGKMSELHAVVGLWNIRRFPALIRLRREKAAALRAMIADRTRFLPVPIPEGVNPTFKDLVLLMPPDAADLRPTVLRVLADCGIDTRTYFAPALHQHDAFRPFAQGALPATEALGARVFTVPFYTMMTNDEMDYLVSALRNISESYL